jgi:DNA-binding LacI/PurR family transcriptional regulator
MLGLTMPSATIRDVAKLANVSTATVSRVLNSIGPVTEETRQKVLGACAALNYSPNPIAQRLSLGRTHMIAVVLPYLTLPSIVERLRGVQYALDESEYDLIPFSVGSPEKRDSRLKELSRRSRVDGLLMISVPPTEAQAETILSEGIPTVLIDAYQPNLHRLIIDDIDGGYLATKHLIELGHQKIAIISDYIDNPLGFSSTSDRHKGYRKALEEAGIPFKPVYQKQGEHSRDIARQLAIELLKIPDPPTAIFATSDTQAIGVLDAAHRIGIRVPQSLSVVGYDDIRDAEYVDLTTVNQPLFEAGEQGAETLLEILKTPLDTPLEIQLPIHLTIRGTTAPAIN